MIHEQRYGTGLGMPPWWKPRPRKCEGCGAEYSAKAPNAKYCPKCRAERGKR